MYGELLKDWHPYKDRSRQFLDINDIELILFIMKSGYVTIVGKPNVGKSTLMNHLLGDKVSIVTPKPQTTRNRVLGILTEKEYQIVFLDTPGIFKPRTELDKAMASAIELSLRDADIIYYMVDNKEKNIDDKLVRSTNVPLFLLINKIDKIERRGLLPLIESLSTRYKCFKEIIPISALKGDGLEDLLKTTLSYLPDGSFYYPEDYVSNLPERFFVAEIMREKIYLHYGEEIPYSTNVIVEEMKDKYIRVKIIVEKKSQKGIIIGKRGEKIKGVATEARKSIEEFLGRHIYLDVWVKVLKNWRKRKEVIRRFGYFG